MTARAVFYPCRISGRQSQAQVNFSQCWEQRRLSLGSRIKYKGGLLMC